MSRGDQLARQWKIIQSMLSSQAGKTAAELAGELESNLRTVYRDLESLQTAGFPIYTQRADGKNLWALLDTVRKNIPVPFSLTELMALYFSRDLLKALHNTVFQDSIESLFQKIRSTLPPQSVEFLQNVQQTIQATQKQYKEHAKSRATIDKINAAALAKKSVSIVYFTMSRRKKTARTVDPYRIWYFNGTFYLVGYCHLRQEVRVFALDRIKRLAVTDNVFTVPEDFDVEDLFGASFGVFKGTPEQVTVRFAPAVAGYIQERVWHASQRLQPQDDGSLIFEAEVAVNQELVLWILSWGSAAEVLEPQALRENLLAEARGMLARYARVND
jgi:predicted DNA-binding transcriptional regulator YafY